MPERRRAIRRNLITFRRVFDRSNGHVLGHLVDISAQGLMLIGEQPVEAGQRFLLEISTTTSSDQEVRIPLQAESRWGRTEGEFSTQAFPPFYVTGFLITEVPAEASGSLRELVNTADPQLMAS